MRLNNLQFNQFDKATIKKEFYKNNIKYLELSYTDEETNKIYLIKISYKRYLLQKYLGYLIPKEHHIISLDGNEENYDVYNLGIRDEDNESPVYKGWEIFSILKKSKDRNSNIIRLTKPKQKSLKLTYHCYLYEKYFGRKLLTSEKVIPKDKCYISLNLNDFKIFNIENLCSDLYPGLKIKGPYSNSIGRKYVTIHYKGSIRQNLVYSRFLMQNHLGRLLNKDETIHHKDGDYFNETINNYEILDRATHNSNDTLRLKPITLTCQFCKKEFVLAGTRLGRAYADRRSKNRKGPYCSQFCGNRSRKLDHKNILPKHKEYYLPNQTSNLL